MRGADSPAPASAPRAPETTVGADASPLGRASSPEASQIVRLTASSRMTGSGRPAIGV